MELTRSQLRPLQWAAAAGLLWVALANCGLAFFFPLELELREGTSWLHALTGRAGISIYDHTQVAFLNMNHGPLDPLFKQTIAFLCPFLTPAMVTRFFVPLLPLGLFLAMHGACRNKLAASIWALGLYLFLLGIQPPNFLIGRSDPAALFLLSLLLWQTSSASKKIDAPVTPPILPTFVLGLIGAGVILTNWRFTPAVGVVLLRGALESAFIGGTDRRPRLLWRYIAGSALGMTFVGALVFFGLFHGNGPLYYRHFFGFFSSASGWGTLQDAPFELVPPALMISRWPLHILAAVAVVVGFIYPSEQLPRRFQAWVSLPLLAMLWLSCTVAYFFNHAGGGLYYFGPFYVLLVHHLLRAVAWPQIKIPGLREALLTGLFFTLPWSAAWRQAERLENSFGQAFAFLAETRKLAAGATVRSEDLYFFQDRYAGEMVDMGDVVFKVKAAGYFGAEFDQTADRYFALLVSDPPRFILTGGLGSPPLQALLARSYRPVLRVPSDPTSYAGPAQTLYRFRSQPE